MVFENRRVERQPNECGSEQHYCNQPQTAMWQARKQPEQGHAFYSPAKGDPFTIKLEWENQTNEEKEGSALPGETRVALCGLGAVKFEQSDHSHRRGQNKCRRHESHPIVREGEFEQLINNQELKALGERAHCPHPDLVLLRGAKGKDDEKDQEKAIQNQSGPSLAVGEAIALPDKLKKGEAKERGARQPIRLPNDRGGEENHTKHKGNEENRRRIRQLYSLKQNHEENERREGTERG